MRYLTAILAAVFAAVKGVGALMRSKPHQPELGATFDSILVGAYVNPTGKGYGTEAEVVAFEAALGQTIAFDHQYSDFLNWGPLDREAWDIAGGRIPLKSWSASDGNGGAYLLTDIIAGKYDAQLAVQAAQLKALSGTIYVRLFQEFDDSASQKIANPTSDPKLFVAAWQHIWNIAHAPNVKFVWDADDEFFSHPAIVWQPWYPGSAYVDVVAGDRYLKPGKQPEFKARVCAVAQMLGKPSMIAESGAPIGDQVAWFGAVKQWPLDAYVYWDAPGAEGYSVVSPQAFAALRAISE